MTSNGKQLESLVAFVESTLLPQGFKVTTNERILNDEGVQIAEFDIEIHGKVGSTEIAWLIECRDRPSSGPAPGAWIEQLVGRRTRFRFNKVTAVSTTGFASGASEFAQSQGIELREVQSLTPEEFADWLELRHITQTIRFSTLLRADLILSASEPLDRRQALEQLLQLTPSDSAFLRSSTTGELITPAMAFSTATAGLPEVYNQLKPNGAEKLIKLNATYTDEVHYFIDTEKGKIRIHSIIYTGELRLVESIHPLTLTAEYKHSGNGETISQVASFAPQTIMGMKFSTEFHKMSDTGETHIIMRRLSDGT